MEKAFGSKICPLFYKFMILTKKNYVDGCIKPCKKEWYEVPVNWYRISTINSINKKNCSKVGALSETLVTNATSVLTCSHGCTSRTAEWNIKESCLDVQLKPWKQMIKWLATSLHPTMYSIFTSSLPNQHIIYIYLYKPSINNSLLFNEAGANCYLH